MQFSVLGKLVANSMFSLSKTGVVFILNKARMQLMALQFLAHTNDIAFQEKDLKQPI